MRTPILVCDSCGSTSIRRSKRQSVWEMSKMLMGIYPFRCTDCGARFWVSVWLFSKLPFAKCPKCLSVHLSNWPEKYFPHTLKSRVALTFGAHRYRCLPCRYNFMSFRPRLVEGTSGISEAILTE
jgi:DNA-directed RNA polymerase subunit RPC12/RpoP